MTKATATATRAGRKHTCPLCDKKLRSEKKDGYPNGFHHCPDCKYIHGEDCPKCGASLEQNEDAHCNRCGAYWPLEKAVAVAVRNLRDRHGNLCVRITFARLDKGLGASLPTPPAMPPTVPAIHGAATAPGEHMAHGGQSAAGAAPDTKALHSTNGVYHPERAALHEKILSHFSGGGEDADLHSLYADHAAGSAQKHAIFTMGGGGSGKSYYAAKKFLKHPRFTLIDPDAIKEHLPEYDPKSPGHVHEESSDLAKRLHAETMAKGKSFVYDGTGANAASLAAKMRASKEAGYKVHLHYASVPMETALQRNRQRTRQVDEGVLREQHSQVRASFGKVRGLADKVRVFDNSSPSENPYAAKRAAKIAERSATYNEPGGLGEVVKSALAGMTASRSRPAGRRRVDEEKKHEHDDGKLKYIYLKPHHYIVGHIKGSASDAHVHVVDIVDHGTSEKEMLGERPDLKPIPLKRLASFKPRIVDAPLH